jgi:peroxidase
MAFRFRTLDFRTIDGSGNNIADPSMNQTDTDFIRIGPANFVDGFNEMIPEKAARI